MSIGDFANCHLEEKKTQIRFAELNKCVFVKTVLMVCVVVYHSILFWGGMWFTKNPAIDARLLGEIATWMNSFHIYGFTLVSGYIFYHVKSEAGKYRVYKSFLRGKVKRLLIPYFFVVVIWVIPFQCLFLRIGVVDILKNYVFGMQPSQLWFLLMLFDVFAIMWLLSKWLENRNLIWWMAILVLYGIGVIGQRTLPNVFQVWTACRYCLFFGMGMKLCQYSETSIGVILRRIPAWLWLAVHVVLCLLVSVLPTGGVVVKLLRIGLELVQCAIGALMAFFVLGKISEYFRWRECKGFAWLIKNNYPIYLFHQQLIFCSIYALNGRLNPYIHAVLNVIIAFCGSGLIAMLFMRFKATRLLIGEKV